MIKVLIERVDTEDNELLTYEFATEAEASAFSLGVSEAVQWGDLEVMIDGKVHGDSLYFIQERLQLRLERCKKRIEKQMARDARR